MTVAYHALAGFVLIHAQELAEPDTCLAAVPCPTSKVVCMGALFRTCGDCDLAWCKGGATTPTDDCQIVQLADGKKQCVQKTTPVTAPSVSIPKQATSCRAPTGVSIPGLGSAPPKKVSEETTLLVCTGAGCQGGVKLRCTPPQDYTVDGACSCSPPPPSPVAPPVLTQSLAPTGCEAQCRASKTDLDVNHTYCNGLQLPSAEILASRCATHWYKTYCAQYCCLNAPAPLGCAPPQLPPTTTPAPVYTCVCDNGTEATGGDCERPLAHVCVDCDPGFKMNWVTNRCEVAEIACNAYDGCPVNQPRIDPAAGAGLKCNGDRANCTATCCKPAVRCDSFTAQCPGNQPPIDGAASVECTAGVCAQAQCCKPEVRCDSYVAQCPGGAQPPVANASSVVCTAGACTVAQCCRPVKKCNTFQHCDEDHILKPNAGSIDCNQGPNNDCSSARCCERDPKCPRNLDFDKKCERDCQCIKKWKCLDKDVGGFFGFGRTKIRVCHC